MSTTTTQKNSNFQSTPLQDVAKLTDVPVVGPKSAEKLEEVNVDSPVKLMGNFIYEFDRPSRVPFLSGTVVPYLTLRTRFLLLAPLLCFHFPVVFRLSLTGSSVVIRKSLSRGSRTFVNCAVKRLGKSEVCLVARGRL